MVNFMQGGLLDEWKVMQTDMYDCTIANISNLIVI